MDHRQFERQWHAVVRGYRRAQFIFIIPVSDENLIFNGIGAAGINHELNAATNLFEPVR